MLKSTIAAVVAMETGSVPDAMGLLRFCGCFLSRSRSQISLMRYTPALARQKHPEASKDLARRSGFNRFRENKSGANTNVFFTHSCGRVEANRSRRTPRYETAAGRV